MIMDRETREAIDRINKALRSLADGQTRTEKIASGLQEGLRNLGDKVRNLELRAGGSAPLPTVTRPIDEDELVRRVIARLRQEELPTPSSSGNGYNTAAIVEEVLSRVRQEGPMAITSTAPSGSNTEIRKLLGALTKDMDSSEVMDLILENVDVQVIAEALAALIKDQFYRDNRADLVEQVARAVVDGSDNTSPLEFDEDESDRLAEGIVTKVLQDPSKYLDMTTLITKIADSYYENAEDSDITDAVARNLVDRISISPSTQ